jgi:hypothetical protein
VDLLPHIIKVVTANDLNPIIGASDLSKEKIKPLKQ